MTVKLYLENPDLFDFTATVIKTGEEKGEIYAVLDRTAFFVEGGGQLSDTGTLGGIPVLRVYESNGEIRHVIQKALEEKVVFGVVDRAKRREYSEQHTGQHILSASFLEVLNRSTVSFHMGLETCTIDVEGPTVSPADIARVEWRANEIIREARPVKIYEVEKKDAVNLRKYPEIDGMIRIVEIEGVDRSACCGTHLRQTSDAGVIKILKNEKYGETTRVYFICGRRAVEDYFLKHEIVCACARSLSAGERELVEAVNRLKKRTDILEKELRKVSNRLREYEASALFQDAPVIEGVRVLKKYYENLEMDELTAYSKALSSFSRSIFLAGSRFHDNERGDTAGVLMACTDDIVLDMREIWKKAAVDAGGRGGGSQRKVQGCVPAGKLEEVLERAGKLIEESLAAENKMKQQECQ